MMEDRKLLVQARKERCILDIENPGTEEMRKDPLTSLSDLTL